MNKKGFKLISIITIIVVTSVISGITTGLIINNNIESKLGLSYIELTENDALMEFINIYVLLNENYFGEYNEEELLEVASNSLISYSSIYTNNVMDYVIDSMFDYLGDDYTLFLNDDESTALAEQLSGTYEGVGITIVGSEVVNVTSGSSADINGILIGDIIIEIENIEIDDSNSYFISYIIQGISTESIELKIMRDSEIIEFSLSKTTLDSSVLSYMVENSTTGYLNLTVFSENVYENTQSALNLLEDSGMETLILDLRDNGGGYMEQSLLISELFLEKGSLINIVESNDGFTYNYDETEESKDYDIVVLVNENTASASEILAASLQENNKALLVGVQTYGKGTVQQLIETSSGSSAKYTSANWYTPENNWINEIGITPDYMIELEYIYEEDELVAIIDTQYNKALELLNS